jgi:hypothetical protein
MKKWLISTLPLMAALLVMPSLSWAHHPGRVAYREGYRQGYRQAVRQNDIHPNFRPGRYVANNWNNTWQYRPRANWQHRDQRTPLRNSNWYEDNDDRAFQADDHHCAR